MEKKSKCSENNTLLSEESLSGRVKDYEGTLIEPIFNNDLFGTLLTPKPPESAQLILYEKLMALYSHFNIDPKSTNVWQQLALSLAFKHVPGFRYEPRSRKEARSGRPSKWEGEVGLQLYADINYLISRAEKKGEDLTAYGACMYLASKPKYKGRYGGNSGKTLYRRYKDIVDGKNQLVKAWVNTMVTVERDGFRGMEFFIEQFALKTG